MLRLFRSLRKHLIKEGKVGRYMLYAVGEILLILIGILLALQLNQINENKNSKQAEIRILSQLYEALKNDLHEVEFHIRLSKRSIQSIGFLLDHMASKQPYEDSLKQHFSHAFLHSLFVSNRGPYESIKSKGFDIITNDSLRNRIIDFYEGRYTEYSKSEQMLIDFVQHFREVEAKHYFLGYSAFNGMEPIDYELLRNNSEFLYYMRTLNEIYQFFQNFGNEITLRNLKQLMKIIEEEIEQ